MQVVKFDVQCPPWALPKEEVPIQVRIEKTVTDSIHHIAIDLPSGLRLVDTINVLKYTESSGQIVIKEIDKARLSEYDYFGVVVATTNPFDDLMKEVPVKTSFFLNDGTADTVVTPVRIFRPRLEFGNMPDTITIKDAETGDHDIPIHLKFSGFGDITLRCRCSIGDRVVSYGTSLIDEVLRRLVRDGVVVSGTEPPSDHGDEIDQARIQRIAEEFKDKIMSDDAVKEMVNDGKIDQGTARLLHGLADSEKKAIMMNHYKTVSMVITEILADILARTPGDNLQLESKTAIIAPFKLPASELLVEFQYYDVLGNRYDPIQKTIKIVDLRSEKGKDNLAIPLTITADESGAYKDVAGMQIGANE